jgi:hypothetical protein
VSYICDLSFDKIWRLGHQQEELAKLVNTLTGNTTLIKLFLKANTIRDDVVIQLVNVLIFNTTLKCLFLSVNRIGCLGATALANLTNLNHLCLTNNEIGNDGAIALANGLRFNTTMTALGLAMNNIRDTGAIALFSMLQSNSTMIVLRLDHNAISADGGDMIATLLEKNTTLRRLELSNQYNFMFNYSTEIQIGTLLRRNVSLFDNEYWNPLLLPDFNNACRDMLLTALLCNQGATLPFIPMHMWVLIFSHFQRKSFY